MKTFITIFILSLLALPSFSQDNFEDWFKNPMEMERSSEVFPLPGPINTNPTSSVFFNINISQNSAPQNEPSVAISRKNPNRVIAAWRDFRYGIDPNANRRVGFSYSTNSGLTWSISAILDSTLLPNLTRNSDPVAIADTAGNFYIAVIAISPTGGNLTLALYKSTNGGVSFPNAYIAAQSGLEDKEWITCDITPSSPHVNSLYISWTRFSAGSGIKLTKSTNGGVNWSTPVNVSDVSSGVQGSNLCVSRNGQVSIVWLGFSVNANIMFDRSTNGGANFGTDLMIASGTPPSGLPNGVGTFPSIAVDNSTGPRSGWLYVTFADNRNGNCDVFLCRSTNNGVNWSSPLRVNNDPINNGKIQYWSAIAVNELGNINIIFMDTRN
ncbi:MAG: sialidase family protein, partial [Ignavibacteria bacterium]